MDSVFARMPQEFRSQIVPFSGTNDSFAKDWLSQSYFRAKSTENHLFETIGKDLVRSKSEVIIADRLWEKGIPYRYEQVLILGDVFETYRYYPDFTILNKRTRQTFYWEHMGKLGDENYCNSNIQKLDIYAQYGIIQGKNLILTYESKSKQISTKLVDIMIDEFLS